MQAFAASLNYIALAVGVFAGVQLLPAAPVQRAEAVEPALLVRAEPNDFEVQALRLAERARIDEALASARPPVPWLREDRPIPWVPPSELEVTVPAATVASRRQSAPAPERAKAKIEEDGYRSVRLIERDSDGKWRAVGLRGNTEVALSVDDKGNVSMQ